MAAADQINTAAQAGAAWWLLLGTACCCRTGRVLCGLQFIFMASVSAPREKAMRGCTLIAAPANGGGERGRN